MDPERELMHSTTMNSVAFAESPLSEETPLKQSGRSIRAFDYALMVVIIWTFGGNALIAGDPARVGTAVLAVILLVFALIRAARFSKRQVFVICVFVGIFAAQAIDSDAFTTVTMLGFFARFAIALGAAVLIRDFAKAFIGVIFWTALISLPIYVALIATHGGIASVLGPIAFHVPDPDILIYYFPTIHSTQNNAYFWEPGVFGGYLILAIVFLGATKNDYEPSRYRLLLYVLLIAVATTKSTGAYMTVLFAMLYHGKAIGKHPLVRVLVVFAAVLGGIYLFQEATFLGGKIQTQFEMVDMQSPHWQATRLGSLLSDWQLIKVHPVIGWGPNPEARYAHVSKEIMRMEGNGLSNFIVQFGAIGLAVFLASCWAGFRSIFGGHAKSATLGLIIFLLLLNDEGFLNIPIFMSLMFMHAPVQRLSAPVTLRPGTVAGRGGALSPQAQA
jgi:hypothetical protein